MGICCFVLVTRSVWLQLSMSYAVTTWFYVSSIVAVHKPQTNAGPNALYGLIGFVPLVMLITGIDDRCPTCPAAETDQNLLAFLCKMRPPQPEDMTVIFQFRLDAKKSDLEEFAKSAGVDADRCAALLKQTSEQGFMEWAGSSIRGRRRTVRACSNSC